MLWITPRAERIDTKNLLAVDRRTFLARLALAAALPFACRARDGIAAALQPPAPGNEGLYEAALNADERLIVDALAEGILPATDTPGARAAKVPEFIALLFHEWMLADEQRTFRTGLATLDAECTHSLGRPFADCAQAEQLMLLEQWDRAASQAPPGSQPPFFRRFKNLVVTAYYTSEIGQVEELKIQFGAGQDSVTGPVMATPPFGI